MKDFRSELSRRLWENYLMPFQSRLSPNASQRTATPIDMKKRISIFPSPPRIETI